jgi:polysaccharide pyruvyl transferase CsaB
VNSTFAQDAVQSTDVGRKRAVLLGYYGARNLGDCMMLHCLLSWLARQNIDVTVVSEDPEETTRRFGVPAVRNAPMLGQWSIWSSWFGGRTRGLLRAIRRSDLLIVGGGDLIRDDMGWKTFSYTMEKVMAALLWRRPVALVNIGIGEPRTRWGRLILRLLLPRCSRIIVRDPRSQRACRSLGAGSVTLLQPDIVLMIPETLEGSVHAPRYEDPYVVVSLRMHPNDFGSYPFGEDHVRALARAFDDVIAKTNATVVFIPFQHDPRTADTRLHEAIRDSMQRQGRVVVESWTNDFAELSRRFSRAACVLAMRLHAAVLAVAHARPTIVMPYDVKVHEFADAVGIRARLESDRALDAGYVTDLIQDMMATRPSYDLGGVRWSSLTLASTSAR